MAPDDTITILLQGAARHLALLSVEEIEGHVRRCSESLSMAEGFGCFTDPTAWMKAQGSGQFEDARFQLDIARHLLAARKVIEKREALVAQKRTVPA